jgi:phosphoribosylamine--glycine ligase
LLKVLIVGGGGREHALAWRLRQSQDISELIAAPGNPGMAHEARCLPTPSSLNGYAALAEAEHADLTVVGPEATLVDGIVDVFTARGLPIVGPSQAAARLEGSKIFAKEFFLRAGIPSARSIQCSSSEEALYNLKSFSFPVVVKADGLAAGKGVVVAASLAEARDAIDRLGPLLVIEEFLEGEEASFIGISNGAEIFPLEASQDHKRISDGDTGPNTGGMGAYCDGRILTPRQAGQIMDKVMNPAIRQMQREGSPFTGFLYAGLMMTANGPKVLEFNVRLGDPEAQVLMHRLQAGLLDLLCFAARVTDQPAHALHTVVSPDPSVCVVLAAHGYPDKSRTGDRIGGIAAAESLLATVFHAGTKFSGGELVTSGGRVLGVTASGPNLKTAIQSAYGAAGLIHFDGMQYRRDIAQKGLRRW